MVDSWLEAVQIRVNVVVVAVYTACEDCHEGPCRQGPEICEDCCHEGPCCEGPEIPRLSSWIVSFLGTRALGATSP